MVDQVGCLVKTQRAATITGLSVSQMNKLRVSGGGPEFLKLGHAVFYELGVLEAWLASHRRRSTAEYRGGPVA
jgi:hypothetical protein